MKENGHFNLRFYFFMVVMGEIVLTTGIALILLYMFREMAGDRILLPLTLWQIALSLLIGGTITSFLSMWFFAPITKLGKAMSKVASGDFSQRLTTDSNINEIRELYSNFNLMAKELSATEILQTDFVSNVSHEFKTPISAIEGYATLLQDEGCTAEERGAYTDKILLNTRRLSELVGNILLLSKLENQAIQRKDSQYRLDEQIRRSILLLEPKWSEKDIDFDLELEERSYMGNEGLMSHVWNNIIGNAIKFSPDGGRIGVKMSAGEEWTEIRIEDEGPGIPPESMEHIFDKFYQSDSSRKEEGSGLGLALVKRVLSLCGGRVRAENRPEGGCVFTVTLSDK